LRLTVEDEDIGELTLGSHHHLMHGFALQVVDSADIRRRPSTDGRHAPLADHRAGAL
jgi:hypothetical protein